ncbi:MAG: glycoside hydrolase family 13 protein [Nocardioidaceae bacterium]
MTVQHLGDTAADEAVALPWWATAVVYQVYLRSFADGDGDGLGDIAGLRSRLPYLASLGVDALWVNPWYPSPMEDAGYDVSDYRAIEPAFGTLADAEDFVREAHECGFKVLLDIVPNHTSATHPWFEAALRDEPGARERYIFRAGRGPHGAEPPNDWRSNFGGPAWTRTTDPDGAPGEWYLHLFAPGQPDLEWSNPQVRGEFEDTLRFWFDRGIDGFRIDVAHGLSKAAGLPDAGDRDEGAQHNDPHPAWDQDEVHDIYRAWRKVADSYDPPRIFVAEAWVSGNDRLARYVRSDELHTAFQFDLLRAPWRAAVLREVINDAAASAASVGAPSTWVLSNHDVVRHATRYARSQPDRMMSNHWERSRWAHETPDRELGLRRARAAILLALALPGVAYLYQGEELGLDEVEDIPGQLRQDPTWVQSGYTDPGRDGCRVPLPWSGGEPPFGFSPDHATAAPWLPQPTSWAPLTAQRQDGAGSSTLTLYRRALALRRERLADLTPLSWVGSPDGSLAFRRGWFSCWVNTGVRSIELPAGRVLLASTPGTDGRRLPADTTVWLAGL